ncbi:MAG: hypothetical protein OXF41_03560 [bacterium]|nr:hypothetical protein [bacterium]
MSYPIDVAMDSGAVKLGTDVVCDGFSSDARVRVQTHVHADHMDQFETSKGHQVILSSEQTRRLLIAEYDADLPYRSNVVSVRPGENYSIGDSAITLLPNGHMLGSVQVKVRLQCGVTVGYSGDFQWPIPDVIQVDALVIDSTYGAPHNIREFTQGECEERFVMLLQRLLSAGPIVIKAHRGTVQRALQIINDEIDCPVIASTRLIDEVSIYREYGYTIGNLITETSPEARQIMKDNRHIVVYSTGDHAPVDIGARSKVVLSAYFTRPDMPISEYSDRAYGVAMSNHADFNGTLEYIRMSRASFVVTDNSRGGKGVHLARAIKDYLGIEARPSSNVRSRIWGE